MSKDQERMSRLKSFNERYSASPLENEDRAIGEFFQLLESCKDKAILKISQAYRDGSTVILNYDDVASLATYIRGRVGEKQLSSLDCPIPFPDKWEHFPDELILSFPEMERLVTVLNSIAKYDEDRILTQEETVQRALDAIKDMEQLTDRELLSHIATLIADVRSLLVSRTD